MTTPRLYWNNFVVNNPPFGQLIDNLKQNPEHREFELRFGLPIRSQYDGVYDFNPNLGESLFSKYREIMDRVKDPVRKEIQIVRKSVRNGDDFYTIRNVDGVYSTKTSVGRVDNLVSIKSATNESVGDMRNLFILRFALSSEVPATKSDYNKALGLENKIQRVRYSYDFDTIIVDLTHDVDQDDNSVYSLEVEYKNRFLDTITNLQYLQIVREVFNQMKIVLSALFPDATDIYEYNVYRNILEIGWGRNREGQSFPKKLGRPVNISRSDVPILYEGYAFTNKLNGVFFRLVISSYDVNKQIKYTAYLLNDLEVRVLTGDNPGLQPYNNTIIDVEFFKDELWAFDCPVFQGRNNTMRSHEQRMQTFFSYVGKISSLIGIPLRVKRFFYEQDPVQGLSKILEYMYETFGEAVDRDNDGIVMTPFGRYTDEEGRTKEKIYYDSKYRIYKWKFPSTVSIDFLIQQIDQYDEADVTYKVFNLFAQDRNNLVQLKPFYSQALDRDFVPPAVFKIDNRHRHYNDLVTGKIIEVTYDKDSNSFVLYHIRTDKTRANGIKVAQDTFIDMAYEFSLKELDSLLKIRWKQMRNPQTGDYFYTDLLTRKTTTEEPERFYPIVQQSVRRPPKRQEIVPEEETHCLKQYREYHNHVKREIINEFTSGKTVLDLGTGKGGDLAKYRDAKIKWLWALEPFAENIENPDDGLYRRIQNIFRSSDFIKYSASIEEIRKPAVPIMTIHGGAQDTALIRHAMTRKIIEENRAYDLADTITSFFSMSFFFNDAQMLDKVVQTINRSLQVGGYFVGTMMDGQTTYDMLQTNDGLIEEKGCYYIKRMYDASKPLGIGNQIAVNLSGTPTVADEQTEWLAPFSILEERLRFKNIRLVAKVPLTDNDRFNLTPAQKTLSSLYIRFVFQKISQEEAERERVLKFLDFGNTEKGKYLSPDIYDGDMYRTGATQEGSCFFSSFLISFLPLMGELGVDLDQKDIKKLTYAMRENISQRVTFEMYTSVKSTDSVSKLLEAVLHTYRNKKWASRLENLTEELTARYFDIASSLGYHNTIKRELISALQKLDPSIGASDIDRLDKAQYKEYVEEIASPTEWANNTMFDMISIVTSTNILIIKDTTRSSYEYISCDVYKPELPFVIFINIGGGEGQHFEPIFLINSDGSMRFRFSFSDEIIQKLYRQICQWEEESEKIVYYDTKTKRQLKALIEHDFPRLSSLVYKATNSDKCVQILRQPFTDDLELLVKLRDCNVKGDAAEFIKARQKARTRDVLIILTNLGRIQNKALASASAGNIISNYLDFGGSDGAISSAIADALKIPKNNAYSADIKEWFTREINRPYNNITYITIIPDTPLKIQDSSIDLITCFQVLHHVENVNFALDDFNRILKPGGILIIREHDCENPLDRMLCDVEHSLYEISMEPNPDMEYLDKYKAWYRNKAQWRALLADHGFKAVQMQYPYKESQTKYYYEAFIKENSTRAKLDLVVPVKLPEEIKSTKQFLPEGDTWIENIELPDELKCDTKLFGELMAMRPQEHGKVIVMGREVDVPRFQKSYGQDYFYSGLLHKADPINHPYLLKLLEFVNKHSGKQYKQMLINWYLDGTQHISPHADDTKQLEPNSSIYSFSFGATRDFVVTSKKSDYRLVLPLTHNTCIVMGGEMQKYYHHAVPKRLKVREPRINVTMRLYKPTTVEVDIKID